MQFILLFDFMNLFLAVRQPNDKVPVDYNVIIAIISGLIGIFLIILIWKHIRIWKIKLIPSQLDLRSGEVEIDNQTKRKCFLKVTSGDVCMDVVDISIAQRLESMYEGEITDYIPYDFGDARWERGQTEFHIILPDTWPVFMIRPLGALSRRAINMESIITLSDDLHEWALLRGLDKKRIKAFFTKRFQNALNGLRGATLISYGDVLRLYYYGCPLSAGKIKEVILALVSLIEVAPDHKSE